jgi:hypothetical protein
MRSLLSFFCMSIILAACNADNKPGKSISEKGPVIKEVNDTAWKNIEGVYAANDYFELVNACHIKYSKAMSDRFHQRYSGGTMPHGYNFDNNHQNLSAVRYADNEISLKLLYLDSRDTEIFPDTVFIKDDTIFVRERVVPKKHREPYELRFTEFQYSFRVKWEFQPVFRHKTG